MPLYLQDPYQNAFNHLKQVGNGFRAKIVGSRVWLMVELGKAQRNKDEDKINALLQMLSETDCDIRIEPNAKKAGLSENDNPGVKATKLQQFMLTANHYQDVLNPYPNRWCQEGETFFVVTLPPLCPQRIDVTFQASIISPRSNFDAYLDENNELLFVDENHKADFDRFIYQNEIITYDLMTKVCKPVYEYTDASSLAHLLKSYLKPLAMGKQFDLETAKALNDLLNNAAQEEHLRDVKAKYGKLYVKGFDWGDPNFFIRRDVVFQEVTGIINAAVQKTLVKDKLEQASEVRSLLANLQNVHAAFDVPEFNAQLKSWKDEYDEMVAAFDRLLGRKEHVELKCAQQAYNRMTELKASGFNLTAAVEHAEALKKKEAIETKLAAMKLSEEPKVVEATASSKKDKQPKKKKKKQAQAPAQTQDEDIDEAFLDQLIEANRPEREALEAKRAQKEQEELDKLLATEEKIEDDDLDAEIRALEATLPAEMSEETKTSLALVTMAIEWFGEKQLEFVSDTTAAMMRTFLHAKYSNGYDDLAARGSAFIELVTSGVDETFLTKLEMVDSLLTSAAQLRKKEGNIDPLVRNIKMNAQAFSSDGTNGVQELKSHLNAWMAFFTNKENFEILKKFPLAILNIRALTEGLNDAVEEKRTMAPGENAFFNALRRDPRLTTLGTRGDTFSVCSKLLDQLVLALDKSGDHPDKAIFHACLNFNQGFVPIFKPCTLNDDSRFDRMVGTLRDWVLAIEKPVFDVPESIQRTLPLAKELLGDLEKIFPEGVDKHPLYVFYMEHIETLECMLLMNYKPDFNLLKARKQIFETVTQGLTVPEQRMMEIMIHQHVIDASEFTQEGLNKVLSKVNSLSAFETEEEYIRFDLSIETDMVSGEVLDFAIMLKERFVDEKTTNNGISFYFKTSLKKDARFEKEYKSFEQAFLNRVKEKNLTPQKALRALYLGMNVFQDLHKGISLEDLKRLRMRLFKQFIDPAGYHVMQPLIIGSGQGHAPSVLLQPFVSFYHQNNPFMSDWTADDAETFYELILEAARCTCLDYQSQFELPMHIRTQMDKSLDVMYESLVNMTAYACTNTGREEIQTYFRENVAPPAFDEDDEHISGEVKATQRLVDGLYEQLKEKDPSLDRNQMQRYISEMILIMRDDSKSRKNMSSYTLSPNFILMFLVFNPKEGSSIDRIELMRRYLDAMKVQLLKDSDHLPRDVVDAFSFLCDVQVMHRHLFETHPEQTTLYQFYLNYKDTIQGLSGLTPIIDLDAAMLAAYKKARAEINETFKDPRDLSAYVVCLEMLLEDKGHYEKEKLGDISVLINRATTGPKSPEEDPAYIDNKAIHDHIEKFHDMYKAYFFPKKKGESRFTSAWAKEYPRFVRAFLGYIKEQGVAPCQALESVALALTFYAKQPTLMQDRDYVQLHTKFGEQFLKPLLRTYQGHCGPILDEGNNIGYLLNYAQDLIENDPYQVEWDELKFPALYKLLQSSLKAALQAERMNIKTKNFTNAPEEYIFCTNHVIQLQRLLETLKSDTSINALYALYMKPLKEKSSSSTKAPVTHARNKGKAAKQSLPEQPSGASAEELSKISEATYPLRLEMAGYKKKN